MGDDAGTIKGYQKRAEHVRAEAEKMTNLESKRELLNIAANYNMSSWSIAFQKAESQSETRGLVSGGLL